jgi:hypothetical protein
LNLVSNFCFCFLAAVPLYDFYKELPAKMEVFRTKQTILECHVNDPNAPVKWFKNGVPIDVKKEKKNFIQIQIFSF